MADASQQTLRQLNIKTGVVRRLAKEVGTYRTEYDAQLAVVRKMEAQPGTGDDAEWAAKNANKVLKDCEQMIAPAQKRLEQAHEDLQDLVAATADDEAIKESEQWRAAQAVLEDTASKLKAA